MKGRSILGLYPATDERKRDDFRRLAQSERTLILTSTPSNRPSERS